MASEKKNEKNKNNVQLPEARKTNNHVSQQKQIRKRKSKLILSAISICLFRVHMWYFQNKRFY